jgi:hypothetical protein
VGSDLGPESRLGCSTDASLLRCRRLARLALAGWRAYVGGQVQKRVDGGVAQALRGLLLLRKAWARWGAGRRRGLGGHAVGRRGAWGTWA